MTVQLAPAGEGTRIDVTTDLSVTGKPAQFGRGVMQDVSDKLLQQFVACIEGQFAPAEPEADSRAEGADAGNPAPADDSGSASAAASAAGATASAASGPTAQPAGSPAETAGAAPAAPAPAAPRPFRPAPPVDDSIDLGATVLPVLVRSYAPYAVAGLLGLVAGWLLGRRSRS